MNLVRYLPLHFVENYIPISIFSNKPPPPPRKTLERINRPRGSKENTIFGQVNHCKKETLLISKICFLYKEPRKIVLHRYHVKVGRERKLKVVED